MTQDYPGYRAVQTTSFLTCLKKTAQCLELASLEASRLVSCCLQKKGEGLCPKTANFMHLKGEIQNYGNASFYADSSTVLGDCRVRSI